MTKMEALCKQYERVMKKIYEMAEYGHSWTCIEGKLDKEVISCLTLNNFDVDLKDFPTWTKICWYDSKDEVKGRVKLLVNGRPQIAASSEYLESSRYVEKLYELYCSENVRKIKKVTIKAQIKYVIRAMKEAKKRNKNEGCCVILIPILEETENILTRHGLMVAIYFKKAYNMSLTAIFWGKNGASCRFNNPYSTFI